MRVRTDTISAPMRHALAMLTLGLPLTLGVSGAVAFGQDTEPETETAAPTEKTADAEATDAPKPVISFGDDYAAALTKARAEQQPVLVVAIPDWYESPVWATIRSESIDTFDGLSHLGDFVPVLLRESRDREVHARHRVAYRTHPLAVVLDADGSYLGYLSGLPAEGGAAGWASAVAAIVPRAKRTVEVRDALAETPDDPALLLELGTLLVAGGEHARADDVFARLERVEPIGNEERLGEARYQRLRMRIVDLLEKRKWGDVEPLCLKWRRRFSEHTRMPALLLLQANARFLSGDGDGARELWTRITADHAKSGAAEHATKCLAEYPEPVDEPAPAEKVTRKPLPKPPAGGTPPVKRPPSK